MAGWKTYPLEIRVDHPLTVQIVQSLTNIS